MKNLGDTICLCLLMCCDYLGEELGNLFRGCFNVCPLFVDGNLRCEMLSANNWILTVLLTASVMSLIRAKKRMTLIGTGKFHFLLKICLRKNHWLFDKKWKGWRSKDLFDILWHYHIFPIWRVLKARSRQTNGKLFYYS